MTSDWLTFIAETAPDLLAFIVKMAADWLTLVVETAPDWLTFIVEMAADRLKIFMENFVKNIGDGVIFTATLNLPVQIWVKHHVSQCVEKSPLVGGAQNLSPKRSAARVSSG